MKTNDLTPAQKALIQMTGPESISELYQDVHATLEISIGNFFPEDPAADLGGPSSNTLTAWLNTLHLLGCLHKIAMEHKYPPA